jgi:hypothetical protein
MSESYFSPEFGLGGKKSQIQLFWWGGGSSIFMPRAAPSPPYVAPLTVRELTVR